MLEADKQLLERELAQQLLQLQQKELEILQKNFLNMATTCAVLIGFGFGGLGLFLGNDLTDNWKVLWCIDLPLGFDYRPETQDWHDPSHAECIRVLLSTVVDAFWALCCCLSLSWNFIALFIATVTSITGPSMALRGPDGSLGVALVHMEQQLKRALRFFGRSLFAFSLTIIGFGAQAMVNLGLLKGIVIFIVGAWTVKAISYYGTDIGIKFHLAVGRAVRAEFSGKAEAENTPYGNHPVDIEMGLAQVGSTPVCTESEPAVVHLHSGPPKILGINTQGASIPGMRYRNGCF